MPNRYLRNSKRKSNQANQDNNNNKTVTKKASSVSMGGSLSSARQMYRMAKSPLGSEALASYQSLLNILKPMELRYPYCLKTFERMKMDDAVSGALLISYVMIEEAFMRRQVTHKAGSDKSKKIAEFLEYQFDNISDHSFLQAIKNIETFKEKGFSIIEKNFERPSTDLTIGGYPVLWKISSLANRPQLSLAPRPFDFTDEGRRISYVRQDMSAFYNNDEYGMYLQGSPTFDGVESYKLIPRSKVMLFGDNANDSNPYGNPLLAACWKAWKEKVLLEDLEMNGAAKDLAGIIKVVCPSDIIYKANLDPNSDEADFVSGLLDAASAVHSGEAGYVFLPSDVQKNGTPKYDFTLTGLDGGSKNYTTSDLIEQRRKAIYDTFGAGQLILGSGDGGSNSLSESKTSIHAYYVKRDLSVIEDVFNRELIPQILMLNNIECAPDEIPKLKAGSIDRITPDEIGKLIQRFASVNMFAATKENIIDAHRKAGFPVEYMEQMTEQEILDSCSVMQNESGAGEGQGTSGTGKTQSSTGGDNNLDNKSTSKLLYDADGYYTVNTLGEKIRLTSEEAEFNE